MIEVDPYVLECLHDEWIAQLIMLRFDAYEYPKRRNHTHE